MPFLRHRVDCVTSPPKESFYEFLSPLKIHRSWPGLNPRTLGSNGNTITVTPLRTKNELSHIKSSKRVTHTMPWRCFWSGKVKLDASLTSAICGSSQSQARAVLSLGKDSVVPIGHDAAWVSETVLRADEKIAASAGVWTHVSQPLCRCVRVCSCSRDYALHHVCGPVGGKS
jgi:hypothetical protein